MIGSNIQLHCTVGVVITSGLKLKYVNELTLAV
jgi:hypothetical protein